MSYPTLLTAFNGGEIAPDCYGRVDLTKYKFGCSTLRNMFASYRGGAYSRAGTRFVGQALEAFGTPPQLIPFSFSATQGYVIEAGAGYFRFIFQGGYLLENSFAVGAVSHANPTQITAVGNNFALGDWVQLILPGVPELSGQSFQVANTGDTFEIRSTLTGATISTLTSGVYTGGGTAARVYTIVSPYAAADLQALKWAQSADVMSITHPNYPPHDLQRHGNANWTLVETTFNSDIAAPGTASVSSSNTTSTASMSATYQYVVTAVADDGQESVASPVAEITNSVLISVIAATNTVEWSPVTGASYYNVYRAPVGYATDVPVGSLFGYAGQAFGTSFNDTNIQTDDALSPPTHRDPFATSSITRIAITGAGSGYTQSSAAAVITSSAGTNAVVVPVVGSSGGIVAVLVENGGEAYSSTDTITFTGTTASHATGTIVVGPSSGTWPSVVAYFQQRRWYADTPNNPDTYYGSRPNAFTNFDASIPVQDDDAITGSPWALQVDGIQWLVPMPGGLVILTGKGAWQLNGGASALAVTPANQFASPQAFNGCSPLVRPITINYDILYVQEKGSIVRDLSYNYFVNIYTGTDLTVLSNHLFTGYTITRWDWAEEPYKLIWAVRSDGVLLSQTYLKEQDVYAWARHDTNGLFMSVACVSEPPVNATYVVVQRLIQSDGNPLWANYVERFDDRIWGAIDDVWCADCGSSLPQPTPNGTLFSAQPAAPNAIGSCAVVYGGSGYTAPTATILDPTGVGATLELFVSGGVITAVVPLTAGHGYTSPQVIINDTTGSGAVIAPNIVNLTGFATIPQVFGTTQIGDVIRAGGGVGVVTQVFGPGDIEANMLLPITQVVPNDPHNTPVPFFAGQWTLTTPQSTIHGLNYIEGMEVAVLADGGVVPGLTVRDGKITLPAAASQVVVGLPFTAQMQTLYLDTGQTPTVQGRRKNVYDVVVRVVNSRGWSVGANQPDAANQPNQTNVPWTNMTEVQERAVMPPPGLPIPLFTGDMFTTIAATWDDNAQIAIQQANPLPLQVIALVPRIDVGDTPADG